MRYALICWAVWSLFTAPAYAWDATGHRLVALMAYQQLTRPEQAKIDRLLSYIDHKHHTPQSRFLYAAVWPDRLYVGGKKQYASWHYVDFPIWQMKSTRIQAPPIISRHIVWAIASNERLLQDKQAKTADRAKALRFLVHLVGDIHQPLHCASRYARGFRQGDQGGNALRLQTVTVRGKAMNLHQFWDRGAGLFQAASAKGRYPLKQDDLDHLANKLLRDQSLAPTVQELTHSTPISWAMESYTLARHAVYPFRGRLTPGYQYQAQKIVAHQLRLAANRLQTTLSRLQF